MRGRVGKGAPLGAVPTRSRRRCARFALRTLRAGGTRHAHKSSPSHHRRARARRGRRGARGACAIGLSEPAHPPHRAVPAGRRHRLFRAARRHRDGGATRPVRHRGEPPGRRHHHRGRGGGARRRTATPSCSATPRPMRPTRASMPSCPTTRRRISPRSRSPAGSPSCCWSTPTSSRSARSRS